MPLEAIREYARDLSELTSVRKIADEIGLGRTTLYSFIQGNSSPHPRVRRVLADWYLARVAQVVSPLAPLLEGLPEDVRRDTAEAITATLERAHRRAGLDVPAWIASGAKQELRKGQEA